jgi:hypothetical protein
MSPSSLFHRIAKTSIVISLFTLLMILVAPSVVYAADTPLPPAFPCGSSPGPVSECNFYAEMTKKMDSFEGKLVMAVVMAALNAMTFMTQQLAEATAQFVLHGGKGGFSQYYTKGFGGMMEDTATAAANSFVSDMQNYVLMSQHFNICAPVGLQALNLQLSIGIQKKIWPQQPLNCSFQQFLKNIKVSAQTLENADLFSYVNSGLKISGSDLGASITFQQQALVNETTALSAAALDRQEGGGLKLLGDMVTGNIKTPAEEVKNDLKATNGIAMNWDASKLSVETIGFNAFKIGIYQLPILFGSTVLNTLASSGLEALKKSLFNHNGSNLAAAQLINPFAQTSANAPKRALAFSDIVMPNLTVSQAQDFVHELSSCPTPRGLWGCAMDDGFAAGLRAYGENGAFSVSRAAGVDTGGKGMVFLHLDWELIPESDTKNNEDTGCYLRAYCASNLSKLRFARILPIGWELAANSPYNTKQNGKYITLGEVLRSFNDCSVDGKADTAHPWCHLIDPSWTLTAPPFECRLKGFSDSVMPGQYPIRMQECSDVVSCLSRDDKGNCSGGYGYCLSEKTVWRFDADACEERYASCRTYQTRNKDQVLGGAIASDAFSGPSVSLIRNTIDYGSCNSNNVGCTYYATQRDVSTTATDQWVGDISPLKSAVGSIAGVGPKIEGPRVYFDAGVVPCDASGDGCTKVYKVQPNVSALNLVNNGSFENMRKDDPKQFVGWDMSAGSTAITSSVAATVGAAGADISYGVLSQHVAIAPLRNYVLSFYAERDSTTASSPTVEVRLNLQKADGTPATGSKYYRNPNTCSPSSTDSKIVRTADGLFGFFQRYTCEFVSNADAAGAQIEIAGTQAVVDGVQLEESDAATLFIDGVNTQLASDDIKLPPEELGCSGDSASDRPECAKYASMCLQSDAGCQGYTDVNGTDNTEIPAILSPEDLCPGVCVGYAQYRKLPSAFDLVQDPTNPSLDDSKDQTYLTFVPAQSSQCSVADVGCEAFTNIESVAQGGETSAAYNYTRQCAKPNDTDDATYFTWEGSDTTGYQLRTWSLVKDATLKPAPPKLLPKAGPDGLIKSSSACNAATWKSGADPDCRQFYDDKGNVFYAFYSQTIIVSGQCQNYRKDNSDDADCSKTGGTMNAQGECIYPILASESVSCNAAHTGCRAFLGTTGRNTSIVLNPTLSASSTSPFVANGATKITSSAEALLVGGHTLKVSSATAGGSLSVSVPFTSATSSLYTVSFWAKTTDGKHPTMPITVDGKVVGSPSLGTTWERYEFGPFPASAMPNSILSFTNVPDTTYLDRVFVERLSDVAYARISGLATPSVCDETSAGIPQPQAMLGCKAYQPRTGMPVNIRQFSSLCRYNAIGCTAYVDTRNSTSAYAQTFTVNGLNTPPANGKYWDSLYAGSVSTTRPADRYVYAVDTPAIHCTSDQESCRSFGKPNFNPDLSLASSTPFTTVYLKDDITKYVDSGGEPNMLCRPSELFCDAFTSQGSNGSVNSYFRDPGQHTCEWKEKVSLPANLPAYPAGQYSGWFEKGASTPTPCYPNNIVSGNQFQSEFTGSTNYVGWTSTCPDDQAECTEFRDPNDHSDQAHIDGKQYFFINNDRLDKQSCNGQVDVLSGCVLFRDMTDSALSFSSKATYAKSNAENQAPESPVNCANDPTNPFCKKNGLCKNVKIDPCAGGGCVVLGGTFYDAVHTRFAELQNASCSTDADCTDASKFVFGTCQQNDANLVLKVRLDRDCATWLGCSTNETVYDSSQGKYVDLCTDLSVCDKSLTSNSDQFCGHYVDRYSTSTSAFDPGVLMRAGAFVNSALYSARQTGFGTQDYSGYTIPNHFQPADLVVKRVGYDLLQNQTTAVRSKYFNDFRMVARLLLQFGKVNPAGGPDTGVDIVHNPYGATRYTDNGHLDLLLCQDNQTKQVGYYVSGEKPAYCYFAIDAPNSLNTSDAADASTNPRNAQNLYTKLVQDADPTSDKELAMAFPAAECKANPDVQSPFPNAYVNKWDLSTDPPKPKEYVDGYSGASYCEYGEDCACSYRKISYGSTSKYYAPYGQSAPAGVCAGGTRDGQSCVPDAAIDQSITTTSTAQANIERASNGVMADQLCGSGGSCQAIQSISMVRGVFGQCLQRDMSRTISGSLNLNPCLVWNPAPLLFGSKDTYHYQPTAGYLPPINSGEYYCISPAKPPMTLQNVSMENGVWVNPPDGLSTFNFDDAHVSEGLDLGWFGISGGNEGQFMDGAQPRGGDMGSWCEDADDDQDNGDNGGDTRAGRWIATGRGENRNYAEYFITFNGDRWTRALNPGTAVTDQSKNDALLERNFAYFAFNLIHNPNGNGRIGCGYTPDWVDNVSVGDYNSLDDTRSAGTAFESAFNQNFKNFLSPSSADYLRTGDGAHLMKVPCVYSDTGSSSGCFYKYWELGYRNEGQTEFLMQNDAYGGPSKFDSFSRFYKKSDGSKAYFAIRAMFEDVSQSENQNSAMDMPASGSTLGGPFRFVGWWVTASAPGTTSERAVYLSLTLGHADICREVAQVVSPTTRQNAAFTDRVMQDGGFSIAGLGVSYNTTNAPFGSAMNTKPIGASPLFQFRGKMPGVQSKLNPPVFIASGMEYARPGATPKENWAWLTDVFARVYQVYHYYDRSVGRDSFACVAGPNKGAWCPNLEALPAGTDRGSISQEYCGYGGVCKTDTNVGGVNQGLCNSLSGVNSGLTCSGDTGDEITGYGVCHNAPMQTNTASGDLVPLYKPCGLEASYKTAPDGTSKPDLVWQQVSGGYECIGPKCPGWTKVWPFINGKGYDMHSTTQTVDDPLGDPQVKCAWPSAYPSIAPFCTPRVFTMKELLQGGWLYKTTSGEVVGQPCDFLSGSCPSLVVFRCAPGSIRVANTDIAISCSTVTDAPSHECPAEVIGGPAPATDDGFVHSQCVSIDSSTSYGHCSNGFEHASCRNDNDCTWNITQWWGAYNADRPTINGGLHDGVLYNGIRYSDFNGGNNIDDGHTKGGYSQPAWWHQHPGGGLQTQPGTGDKASDLKPWLDIGGKQLGGSSADADPTTKARSVALGGKSGGDMSVLNRYPGAYIAAEQYFKNSSDEAQLDWHEFIPAHCERAPALNLDGTVPYAPSRLMGGEPTRKWKVGLCAGGVLDGATCSNDKECTPPGVTSDMIGQSTGYCEKVASKDSTGKYTPDGPMKWTGSIDGKTMPSFEYSCVDTTGKGDPTSLDPDKDNNTCTHGAGYHPRPDLCGSESREDCLTSVDQSDAASFDPRQALTGPPTDVTNGMYTPLYLGKDPVKFNEDYRYMAYYTPRPPTIAAPDTTQQCSAGGTCPIARSNAFTFENQVEGVVPAVGGQTIASIRFYGWATDNQGPIKNVLVDWGDGKVQEYQDASMKNKKPFCGGTTECENVPGLTCQSDSDCPVGGGRCVSTGTCRTRSYLSCHTDDDCNPPGFATSDKCMVRTTFGNTSNACEQNYFDYTHSYACGSEARTTLPACGSTFAGVCRRNNSVGCNQDSSCGPLDTCDTKEMAPAGGCFDAVKEVCRYTPRVLVKDNWGWCTGECRVAQSGGKLTGGLDGSRIGFPFSTLWHNNVLLNNGGCYDGTVDYKNTDPTKSYVAYTEKLSPSSLPASRYANMCDPQSTDSAHSPWVIFNGSLQLGITQ